MSAQDLEQRARELLEAKHRLFADLSLRPFDQRDVAVSVITDILRHQPAPVVDDARMARALEWARDVAQGMPASAAKEHLPAIEEAIAAYDPNCGARTVRVAGAVCNWRQQDEDGDHISTSCGHEFILNDAGDYEDGRPAFPFCCYCSKPTMFHRWRDEPECSCDHSDGDAPECEGCADRRNRAALARAQGVQP